MDAKILVHIRQFEIGTQFGGKYFSYNIRFVRLLHYGGNLSIGIGVSCLADCQIKAQIKADGILLEELESGLTRNLPSIKMENDKVVYIDLNQSTDLICDELAKLPVATHIKMTGTMIVARNLVHAELSKRTAAGGSSSNYMKEHLSTVSNQRRRQKATLPVRLDQPVRIEWIRMFQNFKHLVDQSLWSGKVIRSQAVVTSGSEYNGFISVLLVELY
ncbi:MAG: fumarate hydratase C-terminal domain-containing protein [Aestuariivita sp.]|nr:fumarate hydratase C-terminal domain-containing protein [Aestuariivita sp.]